MRFGIYGGSFDPIHLGHVAAAAAVRDRRALDRVWLIPAGEAPHKRGCVAPFQARLAMARLAVEGRDGLEVLDLEGRRDGPSYTFDTVEALAAREPGAGLEMLVGADMLEDLPRWHRAAELVERVTVVAFGRPGAGSAAARSVFEAAFPQVRYEWLELPPVPASSSAVRRRLAAGEEVAGLLDPAVEAYIRQHDLYDGAG